MQLHLERDGTLVQHNDVLDMLWHVETFSRRGVGIETVNLAFDTDALPNPDEIRTGRPHPAGRPHPDQVGPGDRRQAS